MAVAFDPTDPRHLTAEQRLDALTALLATGVRRWLALRLDPPTPAPPPAQQIPLESPRIELDVSGEKSVHAHGGLTQPESTQGVEP